MFKVKIARKDLQADGIASYQLVRDDGLALPPFSAGSHIDVQPREGIVRQYSLCNAPSESNHYVIGVLRELDSRGGSAAMHELSEGDTLYISEPRNLFALHDGAKRSLLIAGGIGITPILAMAEQLSCEGADFAVHYCARSTSRMAFLSRLTQSQISDHVQLHADDGPPERRLDCENLLSQADQLDTHLYVCGPTGFMTMYLAQPADWAGKKTVYIANISPPRPWTHRTMAVSKLSCVLVAYSVLKPMTASQKYWRKTVCSCPFRASKAYVAPA